MAPRRQKPKHQQGRRQLLRMVSIALLCNAVLARFASSRHACSALIHARRGARITKVCTVARLFQIVCISA